jgi:hypothetical protein
LAFEGVTHSSQTAAIKAVVQHHAMGFLNGEENLDKIHVRYFQPEAPFAEVSGPGANASGNLLQVSIDDYEWEWIAPLWRTRSPLSINAISADRLETLPAGAPVPTP